MLMLSLYILYSLLTVISAFFIWRLMYAFDHFRIKNESSKTISLDDLPTVSVCLPARNEQHAMAQCLELILASTYPKLEIIVLDDSSADNTSVLIKSFAHEGVRFIEGADLTDNWLGKNRALQSLLEEASGDYILYMDVDTHVKPQTIDRLVAYLSQENVSMVSVLPMREDGFRSSVLFGTLRYFWTIILHRKSLPAVASSAWMINRHILRDKLGGIERYKNSIQPELSIASRLMHHNQYRFVIGTSSIGVSYEKKWSSQIDTSVRLMFPTLRHSIWLYLGIVGLLILNTPILAVIAGFIEGWTLIQTMAIWQLCVFGAIYGLYLSKVWGKGGWMGIVLWPIIIAQELIVIMMSIDQYSRKVVTWKGRPVTSFYHEQVK